MARVRVRNTSRKKPTRFPAILFVVVTEGAVTEPAYLRTFSKVFGKKSVRLEVVPGAGDPRSIVEQAMEKLESLSIYSLGGRDKVWALFDRDEHERFDEARNLAAGNRIPVAISNPCFELWGIFHYIDFHAPIGRHDCQKKLEVLCENYDRNTNKSFANESLIVAYYEDAVKRAKISLCRREEEGDSEGSPSTNVYQLTEDFLSLLNSQN